MLISSEPNRSEDIIVKASLSIISYVCVERRAEREGEIEREAKNDIYMCVCVCVCVSHESETRERGREGRLGLGERKG